MSRKAFLICGLIIILTATLSFAILMYLALSQIIDVKSAKLAAPVFHLLVPFAIGSLLYLRFKAVDRRKRILGLCAVFYITALFLSAVPATLYYQHVVFNSGGTERFFMAIQDTARLENLKSGLQFTPKQKIDFILALLPLYPISQWGLFALLWFGSLDPRTPSENRFVQFMKTGVHWKEISARRAVTAQQAHG